MPPHDEKTSSRVRSQLRALRRVFAELRPYVPIDQSNAAYLPDSVDKFATENDDFDAVQRELAAEGIQCTNEELSRRLVENIQAKLRLAI